MALRDLEFSDLILCADGTVKLKGCPGTGSQLMDVPDSCLWEVESLPDKLSKVMQGNDQNQTFRVEHGDIHYRAACINDVRSRRTWFLRRLADQVPDVESLGLPRFMSDWLLREEQKQGLILISGPQASGKTTFASSLVAARLKKFGGHGVTFENPAELPLGRFWGEHGCCFQTEIRGEDELAKAIESAHRYASPDIIFIGEIRTRFAALESLRVALGSSRQIVIATIHGLGVVAALTRLLAWARELDGAAVSQNLADALLAVIHVSLETDGEERRHLRSAEFLLLPFKQHTCGVRAKLRDGTKLQSLEDDMREQRNKIACDGEMGI